MTDSEKRKDVFTTIYKRRLWGAEEPSGPGSLPQYVEPLWGELPLLFNEYGIKSIVDLGCGSFNWIAPAVLDQNISYLGCDIVEDLIETLSASKANETTKFKVLDAVSDKIPKADLIVCRSVLFHLSNDEIALALENIKRSGSKWLLTTSYTYKNVLPVNEDIPSGGFRRINLELEPFNLPAPERVIFDIDGDINNFSTALCLWNIEDLVSRKND